MRKLNLAFVSLLTVAGCSQVIGLSDYDIVDPQTNGAGGSSVGVGGEGQGGEPTSTVGGASVGGTNVGGVPGQAGEAGAQGGQPPVAEGGAPALGGQGGAGGEAEGGAGPSGPVCDSLKCCEDLGGTVVSTQLILHGDFEDAPTDWGTSSENEYDIFTEEDETTVSAHSGTWFAWIGGSEDDIGVMLSPSFTVPGDTGWLTLTGYRWLKFDSVSMTGDYVEVAMYAEGEYDSPEELFFSWDNSAFDTTGWTKFSAEVPVSTHALQSHQITIVGVTDALSDDPADQAASNFFFDDVSFTAYACKP
jgi:hypothetical protein